MARFSVGGDEDENEEGPSNNRRLPKKPRTSDPIVYTVKRASASTSNPGGRASASTSGNPASTSAAPQIPLERIARQEEPASVEEESEDESEDESGSSSWSESSEEDSEEDDEEEENEQQFPQVQPTEARVNSTPNGNGTGPESVEPCVDAPAPAAVSVTLTDPDVLDCPICLEPLSPPVYQCENGHIACASCSIKMRNKCASCCMPIGYNRCRAIEKVLESVRISCRNKQHGCKESLNYSRKLNHEKACNYAPCSCPHLDCTYVGMPKSLYTHFATKHPYSSNKFHFTYAFSISLDNNKKHVFLQEKDESTLFILNRSIEPVGSFVNVVCIASASSKREFLYDVSATDGVSSIKLKTVAEITPRWIAQPPGKKYLLVPNDFISSCGQLKLEITIWRDRVSNLPQTPK
ncbi:hypothetical protein DH2020_037511 [Rehmannia glutinosa]|uniref:RING-type E3 ubiquitin transferase n=1 Tax=Rehmannia glutinosa TaxID=99300 RepID=A0ABR0V3X3_REHGL